MLKTKIQRLIDNLDKVPQEFFARTAEEKYQVLWILNRQKPSIEPSYDFDEERFGITTDGLIIYGFHSGCSCPSPWSAGDFGDNSYVAREYKEFLFKKMDDDDDWFDDGWEGDVSKTLDDILLFLDDNVSVERLLQVQNSEIRRSLMKRVGYDKVRKAAIVLASDEWGELIKIGDEKYVKVNDSSTDREYLLYVDNEIKTPKEAIAWTFYLKADDYQPIKET